MYYLIIHTGYVLFQAALYENHNLIQTLSDDKKNACKQLVCTLNTLLQDNKISLNDLDFIGVNQGPGPFTSLRIGITTANGIAFVRNISLVGLNSLHVLLNEYRDPTMVSIALLNAFNYDLYYAIEHNTIIQEGCKNYELLFKDLKEKFPNKRIRFLGNGALLYKDFILNIFKSDAFFPEPLAQEPSINGFAHAAYHAYINKETHKQLFPLYLKELSYRPIIK